MRKRPHIPRSTLVVPPPPATTPLNVVTYNVAGLRALLRNHPDTLPRLCRGSGESSGSVPDLICLQETKLQEVHEEGVYEELQEQLRGTSFDPAAAAAAAGRNVFFNSSTARKGYSGTAILVNNGTLPVGSYTVSKCLLHDDGASSEIADRFRACSFHEEGRALTLECDRFALTNVYVPNAGAKLVRLSDRVECWDQILSTHLRRLQRESHGRKPTLLVGDLNVAHGDSDFFNPEESRMKRQAGTTPAERASFAENLLDGAGMVDLFRELYPIAHGHYTYYSRRAGNRPYNRGLRLDYILVSRDWYDGGGGGHRRHRSYILQEEHASDHQPTIAELQL